jgi:hypothetical protein
MTFSVAHWNTKTTVLRISLQEEDAILSILMPSDMCCYFNMQEENVLEHTNAKRQLCTPLSTCRSLCTKA